VKLPTPYHLPVARDAPARVWRDLGATGLQVPVLAAPDVGDVWDRLDAAAAGWRTLALEERVEHLARALRVLRTRGPGKWRTVLARSAALSPAGIDAAWDATFAPHDTAAWRAALADEGLDGASLAALERGGRLPRRLVHVLAGNVLAPTLQTLLRGWLLGAAQWLRPAAREPLFAACLLQDIATHVPAAAACTAVLWWPHDDAVTQRAVLERADAVTVQGSDAAVAAVQAQVATLPRAPRCVGYGARWSGALVSSASQTTVTAAGLAVDVALFDQQGCLSPTLVFAERGAALADWCAALAAALQAQEARWPRGPVPAVADAALRHWHECVRLDVALGDVQEFWEGGTRWAVALLARCTVYDTPLDRHVVVVPFTSIEEIASALDAQQARLQGLVVAMDGWEGCRRQAVLETLQPSRTAPPGALQYAPLGWPQDHRPPFASLIAPARLNAPSS